MKVVSILLSVLCGASAFAAEMQDPVPDPAAASEPVSAPDPVAAQDSATGLESLQSSLRAAIVLPTAVERRKAALALAKRKEVSLPQWLEAAEGFGTFQKLTSGAHVEEIPLQVLGKTELTQIYYWVPKNYDPDLATPVMLALHGAGGRGDYEMQNWAAIADQLGMLVLAPTEAGPNLGYAFSEREQQNVLEVLRWFRLHCNVDENRIHLTGVSRGGHLCWDLALRHPGIWASVSPRIGGPSLSVIGGRNNIRLAANLSHIPLRLLQGLQDDAKMILNQRLLFERLEAAASTDAKFLEFPEMGHGYQMDAVNWPEFLAGASRNTRAAKFSLRSSRKGEGEMYWLRLDKLSNKVKDEFQPRVDGKKWNAWSHQQKARFVQAEADLRTAGVDAQVKEVGKILLKGTRIRNLSLRLPADMLDSKGRVEVIYRNKKTSKKLRPSAKVLLLYFVENFDRKFLPVIELKLS
jgi:pimeloyl-ACP methyl ester carboxylesterase